ncbi:hypothetical protein DDZ13_00225 [Coraliomargarita sinensis]|uniref:PA14 domain-containing protein n=1 Tax=Coraliomargarita sinensis TaxID=2174842 RepID=A0A317ZIB9_9BACT|nr:hypothetical protein DDZ13_00225 [Coraliomargarita sinensis]
MTSSSPGPSPRAARGNHVSIRSNAARAASLVEKRRSDAATTAPPVTSRVPRTLAAACIAAASFGPCLTASAQTPVALPFETDFESDEGYSLGPLTADSWWDIGADLDAEILSPGAGSSQAFGFFGNDWLVLTSEPQTAQVFWVDFFLKPVFADQSNLPTSIPSLQSAVTGFVKEGGAGEIYAVDGDGLGSGQWSSTGFTSPLAADGESALDWIRLSYRLDYAANNWDLFVDGELQRYDLGFLDDSLTAFADFGLFGDAETQSLLDYYYVGTGNPLFNDASNDGLPDAWLTGYGLDPNLYQRNADSDFDGLSNITEFALGTSPALADTSGDGLDDGLKVLLGEDPLGTTADPFGTVPFADSFESDAVGPFLDGTRLWEFTGVDAEILMWSGAPEGTQYLRVTEEAPVSLSRIFGDTQSHDSVWIDFHLAVGYYDGATPPEITAPRAASAFYFGTDGLLRVFDGNQQGGGQWLALDHPPVELGAWARLTVHHDYAAQTWSVWIDDVNYGQNLGFRDTVPAFSYLQFDQLNALDGVSVDAIEPAALDNDGDGLMNSGETTAGTDPDNPDSSGDGMNDGNKVAHGLDPLVSDSFIDVLQSDGQGGYFWETEFAVAEGYAAGALDGQNGWTAAAATVTSGETVEFADPLAPASMQHYFGAGTQVPVWLSFRARLTPGELPETVGDEGHPLSLVFGAAFPNSLSVYDAGAAEWTEFVVTPDLEAWNDYDIYLDYAAGRATLLLNGSLIAADLPFYNRDGNALTRLRLLREALAEAPSEPGSATEIDSITLATAEPAGLDFSGDGMTNDEKRALGLDPWLNDNSGDGFSDVWILQYGLDPLVAYDPDSDLDGDGLAMIGEYDLGTDPTDPDSDGDGLSDGAGVDLRLRLASDTGVELDASGNVSIWQDQSLYGNDASQSDAAMRPGLVANAYNGQPALVFDGQDDYLAGLSDFDASAGDFTLIVVHRQTGGQSESAPFSYSATGTATGAPLLAYGPQAGHFGIHAVGLGTDGVYLDLGPNHEQRLSIASVRRSGGADGLDGELALRALTDHVATEASGIQSWTSGETTGYYVGQKQPVGTDLFGGEILEILVYDASLSEAQLKQVEQHLAGRYAIDLDQDPDGDGLLYIEEDPNQNGIVDPGETDPFNADTDGDGIYDPLSVAWTADPVADATALQLQGDGSKGLHIGFESAEGFQPGQLGGQQQWEASRIFRVDGESGADTSAQSLRSKAHPYVDTFAHAKRYLSAAGEPVVWVSFQAKLHPIDLIRPEDIDPDAGAVFGITNNGTISVFDVDQSEWLSAPFTGEPEAWVRYDVRLDYAAKTWKLCVDGVTVFEAVPFVDPNRDTLSNFTVLQEGGAASFNWIDEITIQNVEPEGLDFDGDGLDNDTERSMGTDPNSADTDGDTLPDGWEVQHGFDPLDTEDALTNTDGDILTAAEEFRFGTDHTLSDSDGDGIDDGYGMPGLVRRQIWKDVKGKRLNVLIHHTDFPEGENRTEWLDKLEIDGNQGDTYADRTRGFIVPEESGDYVFHLVGDDHTEFWLSSDSHAYNKERIAYVATFTNPIQWDLYPEQTSEVVTLEAGVRYYFEVLHAEMWAGDYFKVAWSRPDVGSPREVISAPYLLSWLPDPDDQDDDGLPDAWEMQYGLDPSDASAPLEGAYRDFDADGLSNFQEMNLQSDPSARDTDGDGYWDGIEHLEETSILEATDAPTHLLPNDVPTTLIGQATVAKPYLAADGTEILFANGDGLLNGKGAHGVMREIGVTENFDLIVRVDSFQGSFPGDSGLFGLFMRSSSNADADSIGIYRDANSFHGIRTVGDSPGTNESLKNTVDTGDAPVWLRMRKISGSIVEISYSVNGSLWTKLGSHLWTSPEIPIVGLFVASGDGVELAKATYEIEQLDLDSDSDGLLDSEEAVAGTDAQLVDSDGDGISDYDEARLYLSDPNSNDMGASELVQVLDLTTGTGLTGEWLSDANGIHSNAAGGILRQPVTLSADGLYELDLTATPFEYTGNLSEYEIAVTVDGQFVQRISFYMFDGETDTKKIVLPWLQAGTHQIELQFVNFKQNRNIRFTSMALSRHGGVDADTNGKADWIDHRLNLINGIEATSLSSITSPFCLEGRSRYVSMLSGDALAAQPAPADRWYTNIDLNASATTTANVGFENGGLSQNVELTWEQTNLIDANGATVKIRKGDSLLLNAVPAGQATGSVEVTVTGEQPLVSTVESPIPVNFDTAGTFTVTGTWSDAGTTSTGQIAVEVVEADFARSPIAMVAETRSWVNPDLPEDVIVESDMRTLVTEADPTQAGDRVLEITTDSLNSRYVAARLSPNGPILTTQEIRGQRAASTTATSYKLVERYEDGTGLYEVAVVLFDVYPETEVHLDIYAAGVMFEDGSLYKVLTPDDFNELGVAYVGFIRAGTAKGSFCHRTYIYDAVINLGQPRG